MKIILRKDHEKLGSVGSLVDVTDGYARVRVARELSPGARYIHGIEEAVEHALDTSGSSDLVLVTGSFYSTSPARALLRRMGERKG